VITTTRRVAYDSLSILRTIRLMVTVAGWVLVGLGIFGFLWAQRREFYRRNGAGLLIFANFRQAVLFRVTQLALRAACVLVIGGGMSACMFGNGFDAPSPSIDSTPRTEPTRP